MSNRFFLNFPARFALVSFSGLIVIGTFLLFLPFSRYGEIAFFDLLFTATSATCVTGLLTIPLEQFTFFGRFIIMILMQLGALGLSTIGLSLVFLFTKPGHLDTCFCGTRS